MIIFIIFSLILIYTSCITSSKITEIEKNIKNNNKKACKKKKNSIYLNSRRNKKWIEYLKLL